MNHKFRSIKGYSTDSIHWDGTLHENNLIRPESQYIEQALFLLFFNYYRDLKVNTIHNRGSEDITYHITIKKRVFIAK